MSYASITNNYSPQLCKNVVYNFSGLLDSFDYKDDLKLFEIPTFSFQLKKNMSLEIKALYTALWKMALYRSFPEDYEQIFQLFIQEELPKKVEKKLLPAQVIRIDQYSELLSMENNDDFTPVSHHILSLLHTKEEEYKSMNLKIALHIRQTYTYIFDRLF